MTTPSSARSRKTAYQQRDIRTGLLLTALYFLLSVFVSQYVPLAADPAVAVAIAAIYFGGYALLPAVYCAALAGQVVSSAPLLALALFPFVAVIQAAAAEYAIRYFDIDPLFRNKRDALLIILIACIDALLRPLVGVFERGAPTLASFMEHYALELTPLMIVLPFLLRWCAKPSFNRNLTEAIESVVTLSAVAAISYGLFFSANSLTAEIIFGALLLVPLFWIALRLRPRFVTLALVVVLAVASFDAVGQTAPELFLISQFYLIGVTASFMVIAAQEEERRVTTTVMLSQLNALQNAQASLVSDAEEKRDFVAVLAHELRNPLAPVISSIEYLKLRGARDGDESETLEMMGERMSTVQQILSNMLDVSRIWAGKVKLDAKAMDLRYALEAAVLSTQHYRVERHQILAFQKPTQPLWIWGDRVRIEQVFSNLLSNASKYSPSGTTISMKVRTSPASVEVEITDRGIGLRDDEFETIFLPFKQARNGGETLAAGLGIGLALVKSFVELHGGSVHAQSEGEGRGSSFTVQLPLVDPPKEYAHRPASPTLFSTGRSQAPLVLIADDNDLAAGALGRLLELLKYRVIYAYDGAQAIAMALEESPEAILLDVHLPKLDGHAAARKLRESGFDGTIIALSGYSQKDLQAKFPGASPFDHYVVKPASVDDLRPILPTL